MWDDKDAAEKEIEKEAANVARAQSDHAPGESAAQHVVDKLTVIIGS